MNYARNQFTEELKQPNLNINKKSNGTSKLSSGLSDDRRIDTAANNIECENGNKNSPGENLGLIKYRLNQVDQILFIYPDKKTLTNRQVEKHPRNSDPSNPSSGTLNLPADQPSESKRTQFHLRKDHCVRIISDDTGRNIKKSKVDRGQSSAEDLRGDSNAGHSSKGSSGGKTLSLNSFTRNFFGFSVLNGICGRRSYQNFRDKHRNEREAQHNHHSSSSTSGSSSESSTAGESTSSSQSSTSLNSFTASVLGDPNNDSNKKKCTNCSLDYAPNLDLTGYYYSQYNNSICNQFTSNNNSNNHCESDVNSGSLLRKELQVSSSLFDDFYGARVHKHTKEQKEYIKRSSRQYHYQKPPQGSSQGQEAGENSKSLSALRLFPFQKFSIGEKPTFYKPSLLSSTSVSNFNFSAALPIESFQPLSISNLPEVTEFSSTTNNRVFPPARSGRRSSGSSTASSLSRRSLDVENLARSATTGTWGSSEQITHTQSTSSLQHVPSHLPAHKSDVSSHQRLSCHLDHWHPPADCCSNRPKHDCHVMYNTSSSSNCSIDIRSIQPTRTGSGGAKSSAIKDQLLNQNIVLNTKFQHPLQLNCSSSSNLKIIDDHLANEPLLSTGTAASSSRNSAPDITTNQNNKISSLSRHILPHVLNDNSIRNCNNTSIVDSISCNTMVGSIPPTSAVSSNHHQQVSHQLHYHSSQHQSHNNLNDLIVLNGVNNSNNIGVNDGNSVNSSNSAGVVDEQHIQQHHHPHHQQSHQVPRANLNQSNATSAAAAAAVSLMAAGAAINSSQISQSSVAPISLNLSSSSGLAAGGGGSQSSTSTPSQPGGGSISTAAGLTAISAPSTTNVAVNSNNAATTTLANNTNSLVHAGSSSGYHQFHHQIIMSGQQKSALNEKPKPLVVSPQQVMILYMHKLTPYERNEILTYPQIYFIGANAKKRPGIFGPNNSDYDNEQGSYIHIPHDHVAYRYEVLKIIGKGSFGQVVKAYDHKTHEHVALKMVRNEKRFHRQAQEEIRILQHLRKQDKYNTMNIIHMYDYFTFRNHMCITFELLNINLYELIKKNGFNGFSLQLVRKFAHSLLQCLDALYKNKIIHCDMKPENVLLKQQGRSGIKVIDFGSSCYETQRVYTYIQSRFYRAPEVILGAKYGMAIDMWSLGCILAELLSGHALFPGEDEADQLACIIEVLGMPPQNVVNQSKRVRNFFNAKGYPRYCIARTLEDGTIVLNGGQSRRGKPRGPPGSKNLVKALDGCSDPLFLNFLRGCLEWDPEQRMTPAAALKHSWLRRRLPRPPNAESSGSSAGGSTGGDGGGGSINNGGVSGSSTNGAGCTGTSNAGVDNSTGGGGSNSGGVSNRWIAGGNNATAHALTKLSVVNGSNSLLNGSSMTSSLLNSNQCNNTSRNNSSKAMCIGITAITNCSSSSMLVSSSVANSSNNLANTPSRQQQQSTQSSQTLSQHHPNQVSHPHLQSQHILVSTSHSSYTPSNLNSCNLPVNTNDDSNGNGLPTMNGCCNSSSNSNLNHLTTSSSKALNISDLVCHSAINSKSTAQGISSSCVISKYYPKLHESIGGVSGGGVNGVGVKYPSSAHNFHSAKIANIPYSSALAGSPAVITATDLINGHATTNGGNLGIVAGNVGNSDLLYIKTIASTSSATTTRQT